MTLDSWRPGRGSDGWKITNQVYLHLIGNCSAEVAASTPPSIVTGVSRLPSDLKALQRLFESPHPPRRVVHSSQLMIVIYGFSDASGSGFGSSSLSPSGLHYRYGLWGRDISHQSSNYRELHNLVDVVDYELLDQFPVFSKVVDCISDEVAREDLHGLELFLFTDNIVAESAFYRGTSSNPLLFELILRLRMLETNYSLCLHVVHISGKRMVAQGTDGLSRGILTNGCLKGDAFLSFVPLHLSALERHSAVLPWVKSWCEGLLVLPLTPEDWYTRGHGITGNSCNTDGVWIPATASYSHTILLWHMAPTAAEAAIEELSLSRHKRPCQAHIFICPRLFTHTWRKRLFKMADFVFYLTPGRREDVWPLAAYEPIVVGVLLPHLSQAPWCLRNSAPISSLERTLRGVWADPSASELPVLSNLWALCGMTH